MTRPPFSRKSKNGTRSGSMMSFVLAAAASNSFIDDAFRQSTPESGRHPVQVGVKPARGAVSKSGGVHVDAEVAGRDQLDLERLRVGALVVVDGVVGLTVEPGDVVAGDQRVGGQLPDSLDERALRRLLEQVERLVEH